MWYNIFQVDKRKEIILFNLLNDRTVSETISICLGFNKLLGCKIRSPRSLPHQNLVFERGLGLSAKERHLSGSTEGNINQNENEHDHDYDPRQRFLKGIKL